MRDNADYVMSSEYAERNAKGPVDPRKESRP